MSLVIPQDVPTIYVEGIAQMLLGFPNSRVHFYDVMTTPPQEHHDHEKHRVRCELVMPTAALVEMCRSILGHIATASPNLQMTSTEWMQRVQEILDQAGHPIAAASPNTD
ncbi:hypothetical protein [Malikia spinosa]|uniref:hypothetical protein n=1 Tax=Malikia spinosa TaxID=86180 RepID=UPI001474112A|nr:hypothetical protein [Malikia spinosa]